MILEPPAWIPNILEQHTEDLAVLWGQRVRGALSETYSRRAFVRLDARLLAHLDALVLAGDQAIPFLLPGLAAGYAEALTAALVMLLGDQPRAADQVFAAFKVAGGPALDGLAQAMAWIPLRSLKEPLLAMARSGDSPNAIAALGVLAAHDALRPHDNLLDGLVAHATPAVRLNALKAMVNLTAPRPPMTYQRAASDADPVVRAEALWVSAWAGQKSILPLIRAGVLKPTTEALPLLQLFAVIAQPEDAPFFTNLATVQALGPARFELMGRSGFPAVVPALLTAMKGKDAAAAAAAAQAFTCLTHHDPTTGARVSLSTSKDPVEQAFAPEAQVPDPAAAEAFWKEQGPQLSASPRIAHGLPVDPAMAPQPAALLQVDCRAFLDIHLRHSFATGTPKRPGDILRFSTTPA